MNEAELKKIVSEMSRRAQAGIRHESSPVTSMAEDAEIRAKGEELMRWVKRLERAMKEEG